MDRQADKEKEKKRIADRRKTQHGEIPSQPAKTKVSILHLMKHTALRKNDIEL